MIWTHIILHHSLTEDSKTLSWNAIRRYHVKQKGYDDISYHYGVELIGNRYEILTGRPLNMQGAHTIGMNYRSIGICCVGNYDLKRPSSVMLDLLIKHIAGLCKVINISPDNIRGHNYYADYKTCPGKLFPVTRVRERVKDMLF